MDTKWAGCIALSLLSLVVHVISQPGFLSLNCGGKTHSTQYGMTYISDADYIDVGETADIQDASANANSNGTYLHTIRVFPKPLNKSCYQLPVVPNVPYLLRPWFTLGNYSGYQQFPISFTLSIETLGLLYSENNISFTDNSIVVYYEYVLASSGSVLYVCLIRTSDTDGDNPFINAIELRTLREGMYASAKPGTIIRIYSRGNLGGNSVIRYPEDNFDRFWIPISSSTNKNPTVTVSTPHLISSNNTDDFPPNAVMQTAWVVNASESDFVQFPFGPIEGKSLALMYFAEIQTINPSESRSFYIKINGLMQFNVTPLVRNYSAIELVFLSSDALTDNFTFTISQAPRTTLPPLINAYELYWPIDTQPATYSPDLEALNAIKSRFDIKEWISDPCYRIQWKGIRCDNDSMGIRISEMNLSGSNLGGFIPDDIGQLTALVNL